MLRWSLFARLSAILALGLFIVQLVLVWEYRSNQDSVDYRFPLPDRIVAMVQVVENTKDRDALLAAFNSPDLRVFISRSAIDEFESEDLRLSRVEAVFTQYETSLQDRRFAAFIALPAGVDGQTLDAGERSIFSSYPMRLAIALRGGGTLVVETRNDLMTKVFDLPIGFFAGVSAVVAALIILFALRKETRPLIALATAVRQFGTGHTPVPVTPKGAPELRQLTEDFNAMQTKVHDLLTARSIMLGALGHDLRTYLARMRLKIDLLPAADRLTLDRDIEAMNHVLENCLSLGISMQAKGPRDIIEILPEIADILRDYPQARFVPDLQDRAYVVFEKGALRRVITNLVENAIKFAGSCDVVVNHDGDNVVICVSDNGPGMSAEVLATAFDPFVRGDAARTMDARGSGLGLSISKMLAEANEATFSLRSNEGHGTQAQLIIPVYDA